VKPKPIFHQEGKNGEIKFKSMNHNGSRLSKGYLFEKDATFYSLLIKSQSLGSWLTSWLNSDCSLLICKGLVLT
jgi:hypothetical protein